MRIASDGAEAVKILTEGEGHPSFDVVLMDLQMPEMDGFTAARQIRTQPELQAIPIIAMTAHALVEERQRCLDAGMNDHVSKPIDPDALFATLARWAKSRQVPAARIATLSAKRVTVLIPEIDGVDVKEGLARAAGNRRLYRDLLLRFAKDHVDVGAQIAAALERGDPKQAEHIVHTVKGVAGNMSISKIYSSADKMERAIRTRDPAVAELLSAFTSLVKHQVQVIQQTLAAAAPGPTPRKGNRRFDAREALSAARSIRELLEASNGDVVDKSRLRALGVAINEFDFELALSKLAEIERLYIHGDHHDEG